MEPLKKDFITCDMIRDAGIKLAHKMYKEDGFIPDVIYDSLRGGAYLANVISEYYKLQCSKINREPVFYAAVVAHRDIVERGMIDARMLLYASRHLETLLEPADAAGPGEVYVLNVLEL